MPTVGLGLQRSLLRHADTRTMRDGFLAELEAMRVSGATADAADGMAAYAAHRTPTFRGR